MVNIKVILILFLVNALVLTCFAQKKDAWKLTIKEEKECLYSELITNSDSTILYFTNGFYSDSLTILVNSKELQSSVYHTNKAGFAKSIVLTTSSAGDIVTVYNTNNKEDSISFTINPNYHLYYLTKGKKEWLLRMTNCQFHFK